MRISKTVNGVKYTYAYVNGLLMYETRGDAKFYYSYDANGMLYSVKYTLTDSSALMTYYFTHNSRGDIVGIYNGAGQLRAHYEYDAWGNVLSVTDQNGNSITSSTHIGNLNPFRYRGYYFDSETGLYYLMSRYYDPVTHRFINADGYFQAGGDVLDANMSAYCRNNPIMYSDENGEFAVTALIVGSLIGGLIYGGIEIAGQISSGKGFHEIDWWSVGIETVTGVATGFVAATGCGLVGSFIADTGISMFNSISHGCHNNEDVRTIVLNTAENLVYDTAFSGFKLAGSSMTKGKHLKLGKVGNTVKNISSPKNKTINTVKTVYSTSQNAMSFSTITATAPTRTCRGCGRPIGSKPWQCHNGWTY